MTDPAAEVTRLRVLCPGAELMQDGNLPVVFLPGLKVRSGGLLHEVDALLSPRGHHSYETRLFFSTRLPPSLNWQTYTLLARTWYAVSWRGIAAGQPWLDILASHMEVVK